MILKPRRLADGKPARAMVDWPTSTFGKRLPYDGRASVGVALGTEPKKHLLQSGDFLYVPRGFSHRDWAGDEDSVHLTFEIRAFTWHELFAHAIGLALPDLPLLRQGLPPGFVDDPQAIEAITAQRDELVDATLAAIEPSRLATAIEDLADRFVYTRSPQTHQRLDDTKCT